jgi:hypothetical protein
MDRGGILYDRRHHTYDKVEVALQKLVHYGLYLMSGYVPVALLMRLEETPDTALSLE